jgi:hypothetical protein
MPGPFNSTYTGTWARYSDRAQALRGSSLARCTTNPQRGPCRSWGTAWHQSEHTSDVASHTPAMHSFVVHSLKSSHEVSSGTFSTPQTPLVQVACWHWLNGVGHSLAFWHPWVHVSFTQWPLQHSLSALQNAVNRLQHGGKQAGVSPQQ